MNNDKNPYAWWRIELIFPLLWIALMVISGTIINRCLYGIETLLCSEIPMFIILVSLMVYKVKRFNHLVENMSLLSFEEYNRIKKS